MKYEREDLYWRNRVRELEEKVEQLRLSRRVLMNLIEKIEKDRDSLSMRLEKENKRLHHMNYRYARWLLNKNSQIVELQAKLTDKMKQGSINC